ncbi:MAG: fatty acid desaturase, partial [Phycisphaerae bacterium]
MDTAQSKLRVSWYRSPVSREDLRRLNQRSDFQAFLQTGGYLGLLALSGTAAYYSAGRWPWPVVILLFWLHGEFWHFLINGFHEFVHDSVFKTRWLNWFFLRVFSFLGWYNHHEFWASHTEHHKYTLHPPDDLEVVLPTKLTRRSFWLSALNWKGPYYMLKGQWAVARGKISGAWLLALYPESEPEKRRPRTRWARCLLL